MHHRRPAADGRRRADRRRPAAPARAVLGSHRTTRPPPTRQAAVDAALRPRRPGVTCPSTSGRPSCCAPPTCSPARGGTRSTRPPCWASPSPATRPRSTPPRADRLPPLQRPLRPAAPGRAAAVRARHVEPDGPPAAGGLRPRDHAVQLHRHRGQPAARAGADGQHGGLEAVADPAARRALHDAAAGGGRAAARCGQHGDRRRRSPSPRSRWPTRSWPASTSPARPARSGTSGRRSAGTSTATRLPAAGRRDRRQGLRGRPPQRRAGRAGHRAGAGRVRVPGAEVLGGVPGVRAAQRCGRAACATSWSPTAESLDVRRRHRLLQLRRCGDRPARLRPAVRACWTGSAATPSTEVLAGGTADDSDGFFVRPTVVDCADPTHEIFTTEYFGPMLGVLVYEDADWSSDAGAGRRRRAVRADRRGLRHRPDGDPGG